MRTSAVAAFLSLAASAFAYSVTSPTNSTGWTTTGPNVVSWTRVDTDAQNFTIVLSNQASFPPSQQVLNALVDGTKQTSITVNPPSGGWVAGPGYQVNFVKSADELSTILAQSNQFTIRSGTGSSTFSSGTGSSTPTLTVSNTNSSPTNTNTPPNTSGGNSSGGSSASDGSSNLNPSNTPTTTPSTALPAFNMQAGVFAVFALLGSFLI